MKNKKHAFGAIVIIIGLAVCGAVFGVNILAGASFALCSVCFALMGICMVGQDIKNWVDFKKKNRIKTWNKFKRIINLRAHFLLLLACWLTSAVLGCIFYNYYLPAFM